jgi:hypothetical protein
MNDCLSGGWRPRGNVGGIIVEFAPQGGADA